MEEVIFVPRTGGDEFNIEGVVVVAAVRASGGVEPPGGLGSLIEGVLDPENVTELGNTSGM